MRTSGPDTRARLLAAGVELFEEHGLSAVSVDDIVKRAGVAKGSFYTHFSDRAEFLLSIHRDFHEKLKAQIAEAIGKLPHGLARLKTGATVYLDACIASVGVKSLLFDARVEPVLRDEVARRNASFASIVEMDFRAARWKHPAESAKLFVAATAEVAFLEMKKGRRLPAMRAALAQLLQR